MRKLFRYEPPKLQQNLSYAVMLGVYLIWLEAYGGSAWIAVVNELGLFAAFVGGGFTFYMAWFWLVATPYLLLDRYKKPRWLYRFKIQSPRDGRGRSADGFKLKRAISVVIRNQVLGTLPVIIGVYYLMVWRGMGVSQVVPGWFEVIWQLGIMVLLEELLFYSVHRLLHRKYLFKRIHKVHHEHNESIAITTHYVHYLEHLMGNLMPIFMGAFLVGAHPLTILAWIGLAVTNALHSHSGYNFPWQAYSIHHDFHHYQNSGNYGVLGLLDWLFKTDGPMRRLHDEHVGGLGEKPSIDGKLSGDKA